ncbi:MAG: hypothetical protein WC663_00550 [Patescibacteria group bacterium]|jgi:hypothetical protein
MENKGSNIDTIRMLIKTKNGIDRNIFKIQLKKTKKDIYLIFRDNKKYISFHEEGKKVFHFNEIKFPPLFKNSHYNFEYLNPIFSYIPKRISEYPVFSKYNKSKCVYFFLKEYEDKNFMIDFFWVNEKNGLTHIHKEDRYLSSFLISGNKGDKILQSKEKIGILKPINFGNRILYFNVRIINKKNLPDYQLEHIIIYNPDKKTFIKDYVNRYKFPFNLKKIKTQGCDLHQNKNDGSYFISFS